MDVDKKLGMSLEDLIKKTKPARPANNKPIQKKTTGAIVKGNKAKLGYVTNLTFSSTSI